MYRFNKIRLIILLLVIASFQISQFDSVLAQRPNQAPPPQGRTGEKAQPADQKQPDYSQEAFVIPLAEELLKRVLAKEPKHKLAHGRLGYVLLEQGKLNDATEALREQTKINPFDDSAYELLAGC